MSTDYAVPLAFLADWAGIVPVVADKFESCNRFDKNGKFCDV